MIGQLQDAGNTTTLAHYLDLLRGAGLVTGLQKYAGEKVRQRGSSPKLQVLNTALMTALSSSRFSELDRNPEFRGRLVEAAIGAHLLNTTQGTNISVHYWLERSREVDFILEDGRAVMALEVKSGARRNTFPGIAAFAEFHPVTKTHLVGPQGIPVDEFLSRPVEEWMPTRST
jgi:hypothetical protein